MNLRYCSNCNAIVLSDRPSASGAFRGKSVLLHLYCITVFLQRLRGAV